MKQLGEIKEVALRDYWENEATDFTPWLSDDKNLKLLSEAISIELEFKSKEEQINGGRADILCEDNSERNVIIENQLERTDADHLGRIMTYAAALKAYTVIWIASEFDEQYRAAIGWLNEITDEEHNFFGIEMKLFQIGNSDPAPYFKVVVEPNGWAKQVKADSQSNNKELSETKQAQFEFWSDFNHYMTENPSKLFKPQKGKPHHYMDIPMGKGGIYLSCTVNSITKVIGVTLVIHNELDNKSNFEHLQANYKEDFDKFMGVDVDWRRLEGCKQSNVCVFSDFDFQDKKRREEQFAWFKETIEKFETFFRNKIKDL